MQLRLSTRTVDGVLVVDGSGRIVFGEESASLRDAVKKLLSESPKVVLNLRDVTYIDSGGLARILPPASDSVWTFCHSGSARNSAQFFLAASRLGCTMM